MEVSQVQKLFFSISIQNAHQYNTITTIWRLFSPIMIYVYCDNNAFIVIVSYWMCHLSLLV